MTTTTTGAQDALAAPIASPVVNAAAIRSSPFVLTLTMSDD